MGHGRGKSKTDAQGIGPRFDAARRRTRKTGPTQTLKSSDRRARTLQRQAVPRRASEFRERSFFWDPLLRSADVRRRPSNGSCRQACRVQANKPFTGCYGSGFSVLFLFFVEFFVVRARKGGAKNILAGRKVESKCIPHIRLSSVSGPPAFCA